MPPARPPRGSATGGQPVIIDSNGGGCSTPRRPGRPIHERPAVTASGWPVLGLAAVAVVAGVALIAVGAHGSARGLIVPGAVLVLAAASVASGLTAVAPGDSRVVQLFGRYAGTIRTEGLRWVNPAAKRRRVSTKIRNHATTPAQTNDADGNPIEIAAVVVWQVEETPKTVFRVACF